MKNLSTPLLLIFRTFASAFCAATLLSVPLSSASADVLVDWGGNYVSANELFGATDFPNTDNYRLETVSGQGVATWRHSYTGTTALTPGSGYTVPSGKSNQFYGAFMGSGGTAPAIVGGASGTTGFTNGRMVRQNGTTDQILFGMSTTGAQIRGAVLFEKTSFLNGLDSGPVVFDGTSELSFTGILAGIRPIGHFLVQDGSTWYISQDTIVQSVGLAVETTVLDDPNSKNWAVFDPSLSDSLGPYFLNPAPSSGFAAHSFTNIQQVGVFFDSYGQPSSPDGSSYSTFALQGFSVNAVPEPSTAAFVLLAVAALAWTRNRGLSTRLSRASS